MALERMLLDCGDVRDNKRRVRSSSHPPQNHPPRLKGKLLFGGRGDNKEPEAVEEGGLGHLP